MAELTRNAILRISDEKTLQLIDLYRREGCLWNTKLEDYKNREKRAEAAKRIAIELRIKNFGPKHVVSKIKNLRNSYCQELKKISNSRLNACSTLCDDFEYYKPRVFWFNKMNSFLKSHLHSMRVFVRNTRMHHEETEKDGDEVEEWVQMTNPKDVLLNDSNCGEPSCSENDEFGETVETRKRKIVNDTRCSKRVKTQDFESGVFCQTLKDLSSQLTEVLSTQVDCFDTFSRYIASLMRSLPLQRALTLQSKIVEMITSAGIEECNGETSRKSNS